MKGPCEQCLVFPCCKNRILEGKIKRFAQSYLINKLMKECPELRNYLINTYRVEKVIKYVYTLFGLNYIADWHGDTINLIRYIQREHEKDKISEMILNEKSRGH